MKIIRYLDRSGSIGHAAESGQSGNGQAHYAKIRGDVFGEFQVTSEPVQVERLLAPVEPPMIWCIGLNYRRHAMEAGMKIPEQPVVFAKGPNCIQHPDAPILLPREAGGAEVDYECELVVVIGQTCKDVPRSLALDYVLGYTCGNDVSARDWQLRRGGSQWCRGKSFDTFAPIGPCLALRDSIPNPNALRIRTVLNGETMQDANTSDMIFDVPALVAFLSQSTTLLPGTLIFTGTPQGIGMARTPPRWLGEGDEVSIVIEGIGALKNPVRNEASGNREVGAIRADAAAGTV